MPIIGVLGKIGSGKGTFSEYLRDKYGYKVIVMGDIVREIAAKLGLEPNRENLQRIQKEFTSKYGQDYFAREVVRRIKEGGWENVVIDGMRRPLDVEVPKKEFGDKLIVVLIEADPKIRFERMRKRARVGDPQTLEEFLAQERREMELFNLEKAFSYAQYRIENNGTLEEFYKKIDEFMREVS